jgi:hypothetical protein
MRVFVTGGTGVPGRAGGSGPVSGARFMAATGWHPRH